MQRAAQCTPIRLGKNQPAKKNRRPLFGNAKGENIQKPNKSGSFSRGNFANLWGILPVSK